MKLNKQELKQLRAMMEIGPMPTHGKARAIAQSSLCAKGLAIVRIHPVDGKPGQHSETCVPTDIGIALYNTLFPET